MASNVCFTRHYSRRYTQLHWHVRLSYGEKLHVWWFTHQLSVEKRSCIIEFHPEPSAMSSAWEAFFFIFHRGIRSDCVIKIDPDWVPISFQQTITGCYVIMNDIGLMNASEWSHGLVSICISHRFLRYCLCIRKILQKDTKNAFRWP